MSIIADTLQRLQKQHQPSGPDQGFAVPGKTPAGEREPSPPPAQSSRLTFWLMGLSMAAAISALGLWASWSGLLLGFGVPTHATSTIPVNPSPPAKGSSSPSPSPGNGEPFDPASTGRSTSSLPTEDKGHAWESGGRTDREPSLSQEAELPLVSPDDALPQKDAQPALSVSIHPPAPSPLPVHRDQEQRAQPQSPNTPARSPKDHSSRSREKETSIAIPDHGFRNPAPSTTDIGREASSAQSDASDMTTQDAPDSPARLLSVVQQLIQRGEYDNAVTALSPLFSTPPVEWEPWFWMGTALLGQGQLEQADQYFLNGLARNDQIPQLWIQRALVAHQRGEYQMAVHVLRRAEYLDATLPHVHLNMGLAYEKLGNSHLANEYYAKFLQHSAGKPSFFPLRKKVYARFSDQARQQENPEPASSVPSH